VADTSLVRGMHGTMTPNGDESFVVLIQRGFEAKKFSLYVRKV
jgi:hypothetical protein